MDSKLDYLERWERLRSRAQERGFVMNVDRHKIKMTPSITKVIQGPRRQEMQFLGIEEAEHWFDGYDWMLAHAANLGFELKAAERAAMEKYDQDRILRSLSSD